MYHAILGRYIPDFAGSPFPLSLFPSVPFRSFFPLPFLPARPPLRYNVCGTDKRLYMYWK